MRSQRLSQAYLPQRMLKLEVSIFFSTFHYMIQTRIAKISYYSVSVKNLIRYLQRCIFSEISWHSLDAIYRWVERMFPTDSKINITFQTPFDAQNCPDFCGQFNITPRSKKVYDFETITPMKVIASNSFLKHTTLFLTSPLLIFFAWALFSYPLLKQILSSSHFMPTYLLRCKRN